ncbi:MAG: cholesterol oxidase substrate-binding domain-containing protein [Pseudonocardiaceae bacterium]
MRCTLNRNYRDSSAAVRPEWSKGWTYTTDSAWADQILPVMTRTKSSATPFSI